MGPSRDTAEADRKRRSKLSTTGRGTAARIRSQPPGQGVPRRADQAGGRAAGPSE